METTITGGKHFANHRITFIGTWITLIIVLVVFPGFETRGLAMGLIIGYFIGYWPFMLSMHFFEHSLHPLIIYFIMFILSGATVGLCAWFMDKANMAKNIWMLLIFSIIVGAAFFAMDGPNFEGWKRTPAIAAAIESPEVNYQPSHWDFNKQIVIPKTIGGGLLGLYITTGVGFLCSIAILLRRKRYLMRQKQMQTNHP